MDNVVQSIVEGQSELFVPQCLAGAFIGIPDDVAMLQLFQQSNFTDGSAGNAFVLLLQSNFFERNNLPGSPVLGLVYDTVRSLGQRCYQKGEQKYYTSSVISEVPPQFFQVSDIAPSAMAQPLTQ